MNQFLIKNLVNIENKIEIYHLYLLIFYNKKKFFNENFNIQICI